MNEKEQELFDAIKSLPVNSNDVIPNERENTIVVIILSAGEFEPIEDTIKFVRSNAAKGFDEVTQAILNKWFTEPLEIVDDEEE